ncbi:dTDP-4-dehydrorhamnose 3,5-epimerase [Geminocystis sp. GBBB08]|uniref:dTDP-4-dehydrorhamnose 3,5-epimerase n=1 Tax=Geminocystis sp. GBBB08 TaxID=2604140 RepID=UPI0027E375A1|nr:dTDP-4-dehydrorhamnose 3,5-epimerase [Geminocystis sp. GBBB08]MBL1210722.1 dTDP-4-dehydrorhamnose 3,5-epimerase [Geminocystis sp. GBBB08]
MKFIETLLKRVYVIEIEPISDHRGFFARSWCEQEFRDYGLNPNLVQCNISFNAKKGTLRGMHYQIQPHEETKLVRCTQGSIYDVIIDIQPESSTFKQWFGVELTAKNHKMLYIPEGFAHGFQTLEDDTEVLYQMSEFYHPECAKGVRFDDPSFKINWLLTENLIMSEKDQNYLNFKI